MSFNNLPKDIKYMVYDYIKPVKEYNEVMNEFKKEVKNIKNFNNYLVLKTYMRKLKKYGNPPWSADMI